MTAYSAYEVVLGFDVSGAEIDVHFPYVAEDCFGDADDLILKALTPEIRKILGGWFDHLAQLGCVTGGRDDETPRLFLIVAGDCELPNARASWWPQKEPAGPSLGFDLGRKLASVTGASISVFVEARRIEPSAAFDALCGLASDHEMSPWGGTRTPDRLRREGENAADWMARVAIPSDYLSAIGERLTLFGNNLNLAMATPAHTSKATPDFLVDGTVPFGDVCSLVAPPSTGKSSLCHQLLATVCAPAMEGVTKLFLGQEVPGHFRAALWSAEESEFYFQYRQEKFNRIWPGGHIIRFDANLWSLEDALNELENLSKMEGGSRGVFAIDSFQAAAEGDDTKAHIAGEFYQRIVGWAHRTGWSVLLLHHTTKAAVRSFSAYRQSIRGSSVHVQMPRVVFGMISRGGALVSFGVIKTNLPPEIAWLKEGEEVLCTRNAESHTLDLMVQHEGGAAVASDAALDLIAAAIQELNSKGMRVHKSGQHGLWEQKLPSLSQLSRAFIHHAVESLIDTDRVLATAEGLISYDVASAGPLRAVS